MALAVLHCGRKGQKGKRPVASAEGLVVEQWRSQPRKLPRAEFYYKIFARLKRGGETCCPAAGVHVGDARDAGVPGGCRGQAAGRAGAERRRAIAATRRRERLSETACRGGW